MKNKSIIWWALFMTLYALAGWHQRGFVDWYGLAAISVLTLPLAILFIRQDKAASSKRRNASRKAAKPL